MTTDPGPAAAVPATPQADWSVAFRDVYQRRKLGRRYEIAAGEFRIRNKVRSGDAKGRRPGWRPFSIRPGFPQDRPSALAWLAEGMEAPPRDFRWRVHLAEEAVPKLVLTWDSEGNELPLSGWSLILVPSGKKKAFTTRLERYVYLHYLVARPFPGKWSDPVIEVTRVRDRVTVTVGGAPVFTDVSAPPLARTRYGFAFWNQKAGPTGMAIDHPK